MDQEPEALNGFAVGSQDAPGPASARARRKILIVDDSETVLLVERALLSRSYEVVTARNGQEGVEKALAEGPDLILMDVVMPRMNGFDAVSRLRSHPATGHVPIIMVSTRSELSNVESGYRSGCDDYVTKPFHGAELLAKVKRCLGG
jgi:DNA-binding response OmpR family regulator